MKQEFIYDLGFYEERQIYVKVKFIVDKENVKAYYLYSKDEQFQNFGYFSPIVIYSVEDFFVNKKKAKALYKEINLKDFDDIEEIKTTRINFLLDIKIYDEIFKKLNKNIFEKISEKNKAPLSEEYFKTNSVLLISYNNIIKNIKNDNAIKKMFGNEIYPISYYRKIIDNYFPKVKDENNYVEELKVNSNLNKKFSQKTFDEAFALCENNEDVINLAKNIYYFADLKYIEDKEFYVNNIKKENLFLQTIMLFIYNCEEAKNIQNVIDKMKIANRMFKNEIYNDFSSEILKYYTENGNNNLLISLYRKTYANKTYYNLETIFGNLEDVIKLLDCIEGAENFYKNQAQYLENKNKEIETKLQEEHVKNKKLEKKLQTKKTHFNILGILSAGAVGTVTVAAVLFNKFKHKK